MRISDWSSDVCSSDLFTRNRRAHPGAGKAARTWPSFRPAGRAAHAEAPRDGAATAGPRAPGGGGEPRHLRHMRQHRHARSLRHRSEEHTSELQSLMRISYAVFCLKKKQNKYKTIQANN